MYYTLRAYNLGKWYVYKQLQHKAMYAVLSGWQDHKNSVNRTLGIQSMGWSFPAREI